MSPFIYHVKLSPSEPKVYPPSPKRDSPLPATPSTRVGATSVQVPEDGTPWEPGQPGKGLWHPKHGLALWRGYEPHHGKARDILGFPEFPETQAIRILPDGGVSGWLRGDGLTSEEVEPMRAYEPRLKEYTDPREDWTFAKVAGGFERCLQLRDGRVLTEADAPEGYRGISHVELAESLGLKEEDIARYGYMNEGDTNWEWIDPKEYEYQWETRGGIDWTFSKVADVYRKNPQHRPNWTPGNHGKGIIFRNGEVHTWNTGTEGGAYSKFDGKPYHHDYLFDVLGNKLPAKPEQYFHIRPDGKSTHSPVYDEFVREAHPELAKDEGGWTFSRVANVPVQNGDHHVTNYLGQKSDYKTTPWRPGLLGKLLLLPDGLHMWATGDPQKEWPYTDKTAYFDPHHDGIYDHLRGSLDDRSPDFSQRFREHYTDFHAAPKMYIAPDGVIDPGIGRGAGEQAALIAEMHPDLKAPEPVKDWTFESKTSGVVKNTWERGKWGKGFLLNGDGYFWTVDRQGAPHHVDKTNELGLLDDLHTGVMLLIKPNGVVDSYSYPTDSERERVAAQVRLFGNEWPRFMKPGDISSFYEANKLDPFKLPAPGDWLFAEAKTSAIKLVQAPPNDEHVDDYLSLADRRPIIWDRSTQTLYVGNPGWHHTGLYATYQHLNEEFELCYGWIGDNAGNNANYSMQGEVGWYPHGNPTPDEKEVIHEALSRELGVQVTDKSDEDWHFSATYDDDDDDEMYSSEAKWAWIDGVGTRLWSDVEQNGPVPYGGETYENDTKPHHEVLMEMAEQHPRLHYKFDHIRDWTQQNAITEILDKSGVKWGAGLHTNGEHGYTFIHSPLTDHDEISKHVGFPLESFENAFGYSGNAYGIKQDYDDWRFGTTHDEAMMNEDEDEFDKDQFLEEEGWLDAYKNFDHKEPVRYVDHPMPAGDHYEDDWGDEDNSQRAERPVVFNGTRFFVGQPNAYHWDMIQHEPELHKHFDIDRYMETDPGSAAQDRSSLAMGRYNPDSDSIIWPSKGKWRRDQLNDLTSQHFGQPYDESEDIGFEDEDWHFGAYKPDITVETVDDFGTAGSEGELFNDRRPLIFDPGTDTLHVGGYGQYHEEAADSHGIDHAEMSLGTWFPKGSVHGGLNGAGFAPGHITWLSGRLKPEWIQAIEEKLQGHTEDAAEGATWAFGKVASQVDYQPGQDHKGVIYANGSIDLWPVDQFGAPHHDDITDQSRRPRHFFVVRDGVATNAYDEGSDEYDEEFSSLQPWAKQFAQYGITVDDEADTEWRFGKVAKLKPWEKNGIHGGKFLVTPEGDVHHWRTDKRGWPHHNEAIARLGLPKALGYTYGYIEPDGTYESEIGWAGQDTVDQGEKAAQQLGLKPKGTNSWYFGKVAEAKPMATLSEHEYETPQHETVNRRPVLYNMGTNHVYVGPHGTHHDGLFDELGDDWDPAEIVSGIMFNDKGKNVLRFWQDEMVPYPQPAADALVKQYGVEPQRSESESVWEFQSAAQLTVRQHGSGFFDPEDFSGHYDEATHSIDVGTNDMHHHQIPHPSNAIPFWAFDGQLESYGDPDARWLDSIAEWLQTQGVATTLQGDKWVFEAAYTTPRVIPVPHQAPSPHSDPKPAERPKRPRQVGRGVGHHDNASPLANPVAELKRFAMSFDKMTQIDIQGRSQRVQAAAPGEPWVPGHWGKAVVLPDGTVKEWATDDGTSGGVADGWPFHEPMAKGHPYGTYHSLVINPRGEVSNISAHYDTAVDSPYSNDEATNMVVELIGGRAARQTGYFDVNDWTFSKRLARGVGDQVEFEVLDDVDAVQPGHHFVVLKDGKVISGSGHHEWIMTDAGVTFDQVQSMGGKASDGETWWLDDKGFDMRMRWTFAKASNELGYPPWTPGEWGKLLVSPEGKVHHWKTNRAAEPHHFEYGEQLGLDFGDGIVAPEGWSQGYLHSDGSYTLTGNAQEGHAEIVEEELGVKPFKPNWTFSKAQYNVIDSDITPEQSYLAQDADFFHHSPFIVHGNNIYLGTPGTHHADLVYHHLDDEVERDAEAVYLAEGYGAIVNGAVRMNHVSPGHNQHAVGEAVAQHTGVPYEYDEEDDNSWTFSKAAGNRMRETKGIRLHDGTLHTWDGNYFHTEFMVDNDIHPDQVKDYLAWDDEGEEIDLNMYRNWYRNQLADGWEFTGKTAQYIVPEGYLEPEDDYKGLIMKDGREYRWATYGWKSETNHADVMIQEGIDPHDVAEYVDSEAEGGGWDFAIRDPSLQQTFIDNTKRFQGVRGKTAHQQLPPGVEPWEPGSDGKGFMKGKNLWIWKTDMEGMHGGPHHSEVEKALGQQRPDLWSGFPNAVYFDVYPDGEVEPAYGNRANILDVIKKDPRLRLDESEWRFGKTAVQWRFDGTEAGLTHKAIVLGDGTVRAWPYEDKAHGQHMDDEGITHDEVAYYLDVEPGNAYVVGQGPARNRTKVNYPKRLVTDYLNSQAKTAASNVLYQTVQKGTIDRDGKVHVWPVDETGAPHHSEIGIQPFDDDEMADFYLYDDKEVEGWAGPVPERYQKIIAQQLPGVTFADSTRSWVFSSRSNNHSASDLGNNGMPNLGNNPDGSIFRSASDRSNNRQTPSSSPPLSGAREGKALSRMKANHHHQGRGLQYGPWKPGQDGKWIILPDGTVHHWAVNNKGEPHHDEYLKSLRIPTSGWASWPAGYLYTNGQIEVAWGIPRAEKGKAEAKVRAAVPGTVTGETDWLWESSLAQRYAHLGRKGQDRKPEASDRRDRPSWKEFLSSGISRYPFPFVENGISNMNASRVANSDWERNENGSFKAPPYVVPEGLYPPSLGGYGKAIQQRPEIGVDTDDTVYAWATDGSGSPHHADVAEEYLDLDYEDIVPYIIDPEGEWQLAEEVPLEWRFASNRIAHDLKWTPGNYGRAISRPDGTVYTWNCGPNEEDLWQSELYHGEMAQKLGLGYVRGTGHHYIEPDGRVHGELERDKRVQDVIGDPIAAEKADPNSENSGDGWMFASVLAKMPVQNGGIKYRSEYAEEENQISEPWALGKEGKGLIIDGTIYIWAVDQHGEPHHSAISDYDSGWCYIKPNGMVDAVPGTEDKFMSAHPDLRPLGPSNWTFSKTAGQTWKPGNEGKLYVEPDGTVHTWNVDPSGYPHHHDYAAAHGLNDDFLPPPDITHGYIKPDGTYTTFGEDNPEHDALIQAQGLKREDSDWTFSKTASLKPWKPGDEGRAFSMTDGSVHHWSDGESNWGSNATWHDDAANLLGLDRNRVLYHHYITPDGTVRGGDAEAQQRVHQALPLQKNLAPEFRDKAEEDWTFSKAANDEEDWLFTEELDRGWKFIYYDDEVYMEPHPTFHSNIMQEHGLDHQLIKAYGVIRPDHGVEFWDGYPVDEYTMETVVDKIAEKLPNAHRVEGYEHGWSIAKVTKVANDWEFGDEGTSYKWVLFNGKVYMLPHTADKPMYHMQVMRDFGVEPNNIRASGVVDPSGRVEFFFGSKDPEVVDIVMDEIQEEIPHAEFVEGYDYGWKIAGLAGFPEDMDPAEKNLHPIVYDLDTGEVIVGHEGLHHHDIHPDASDHYTGVACIGPNNDWTPGTIEWFGLGTPGDYPLVDAQVSEKLGMPLKTELNPQWKFAQKAITPQYCSPWRRGEWGRYIVDSDGTVYSWMADDAEHAVIQNEYDIDEVDGGYITPDGKKEPYTGPQQNWVFGKEAKSVPPREEWIAPPRTKPWVPGSWGKGAHAYNGFWAWATEDGAPHHSEVTHDTDPFGRGEYFVITPEGEVRDVYDAPMDWRFASLTGKYDELPDTANIYSSTPAIQTADGYYLLDGVYAHHDVMEHFGISLDDVVEYWWVGDDKHWYNQNNPEWHFSSTDWKVQHHDYPIDGVAFTYRQPVLVDPQAKEIHVGPYGGHHSELEQAVGRSGLYPGAWDNNRFNFVIHLYFDDTRLRKEVTEALGGEPMVNIDSSEWHFGSTEPKLVEAESEAPYPYSDMMTYDAYKGRKAFWWYPEENTIYLGSPGMHHPDVQNHFNLPWTDNRHPGVLHTEQSFGFGSSEPGVRFVTTPEPIHEPALDYLSERFNVPREKTTDWRFGAVNHQEVLNRNRGKNLEGLPNKVKVPGIGPLEFHSHGHIQELAKDYNRQAGIPKRHPEDYAKVNPEVAKQIAQAFHEMPHAPNDPKVKESYDALKKETLDQYNHAVKNGYQFDFYPDTHDPYPNSPREAVLDLHHNKRMYVYPTETGYGNESETHDNPLLEQTGLKWGEKPVTYNDVFRAVHDFYGHAKEGIGFRADGEDNAYRQHAAMFSDTALPAITTETRGQNSWVNFGPHGEHNQTAGQGDTVYAPQKAGILPDWVHDPDIHKAKEVTGATKPPPQFVHTQMHPDDSIYQDWNHHDEHAVIYDRPNHTVYVGKPRIHHHDLQDEFGLRAFDTDRDQAHGDVIPNGLFVNHWGFEHYPEVEQHIKNYFNAHKRAEDDEWGWTFTSAAKPPPIADFTKLREQTPPWGNDPELVWEALQEGWTPGKEGKGLVSDDNDLYTWNTLDDEGNPHHHEVASVLEAGGVRCRRPHYVEAIYEDGEFESANSAKEIVQEQDPRLRPAPDMGATWQFQ